MPPDTSSAGSTAEADVTFELSSLSRPNQMAVLLALHGHRLGGAVLLCQDDPLRADDWCARISGWRSAIGTSTIVIRTPVHCPLEQLLGGVDLIQTMLTGSRVSARGLLERASDGLLLLPLAELQPADSIRAVCQAIDHRHIDACPTRICAIAACTAASIAELHVGDRAVDAALLDRLAFCVDLSDCGGTIDADFDAMPDEYKMALIHRADTCWSEVMLATDAVAQLCEMACALGINSIRAQLHCVTVARSAAALAGRQSVTSEDLDVAMSLCLAWRAQQLPAQTPEEASDTTPGEAADRPPATDSDTSPRSETDPQPQNELAANKEQPAPPLDEVVPIPLPPQLLTSLADRNAGALAKSGKDGRVGQARRSMQRGRCIGTQRFQPDRGQKLHLLATLQAAAPWQAHRRRNLPTAVTRPVIKPEDMRAARFKQRTQTVVIFVVDASGSAAQQRLAEAKGAVELLLNECYIRRDEVALIVFQGPRASLVLPPTRSLVTARRLLTQMPAGGGTPLASAIELAGQLAGEVRSAGNTPLICLLTDGRANVDRQGIGGRRRAMSEALQTAKKVSAMSAQALLIDIARRPSQVACELASALGSDYIALPRADARSINRAVSDVLPARSERARVA